MGGSRVPPLRSRPWHARMLRLGGHAFAWLGARARRCCCTGPGQSGKPLSTEGGPSVVGSGQGAGRAVNVAWNTRTIPVVDVVTMGDAEYLAAWEHVLMPIAREVGQTPIRTPAEPTPPTPPTATHRHPCVLPPSLFPARVSSLGCPWGQLLRDTCSFFQQILSSPRVLFPPALPKPRLLPCASACHLWSPPSPTLSPSQRAYGARRSSSTRSWFSYPRGSTQ